MWIEGTSRRVSTGIPIGPGAQQRDSKAQAHEVYAAVMGDRARGRFHLPIDKPIRTFREHAMWYLAHIAAHHRGGRRERSMIQSFIRYFGDTKLTSLDREQIEGWKTTQAETKKAATVNRELDVLKPLIRSAIPKYLDVNPADAVKRLRVSRTPITILTRDAERRLLAHATTEERALIILALDTLMRQGDVRRLERRHDHKRYLEVVDPKGGEPYQVPVSKRLRKALDALPNTGPYYFARKYGGDWHPMGSVTIQGLFGDLCRRAGVPLGRANGGVTFHSLRHTGATRAASSGVKLTVVQRLGGWKSLKQLARYDHPDDPELVRAVEAIGSRDTHARSRRPKNAPKKRAS